MCQGQLTTTAIPTMARTTEPPSGVLYGRTQGWRVVVVAVVAVVMCGTCQVSAQNDGVQDNDGNNEATTTAAGTNGSESNTTTGQCTGR